MIARKLRTKTKAPKLNLVSVLSEDQSQDITTTTEGLWSAIASKFADKRKSDLNFDQWRRLQYRNEWQEQPNRNMSIHFRN